ncbi:hypothetical protein [Fictibacillus fluitans]|uniref:Uncharacterized protein n=1 Tax=Fictibacillus fluitans TaxID=3058422 RepID=A0ABT8HSC4_9BACL|nr:hypothetical protein [Fictibacillus sp. NE201]MDN4523187.1 hypothetical protein [Fictibacillus sp. NE201]
MHRNRLFLFFLVILYINVAVYPSFVFAQDNTNSPNYITKKELDILLKKTPQNLTKEDLNEMLLKSNEALLESRKDKIDLLEGNISSILTLLGIILAVLALLFTGFGFWLKGNFTEKLNQVNQMKEEVEKNKKLVDENLQKSNGLNDKLDIAIGKLKHSKDEFDRETKYIKSELEKLHFLKNHMQRLEEYVNFHFENIKIMHDFNKINMETPIILKEIEDLLNLDLDDAPIYDVITEDIKNILDYHTHEEVSLKNYLVEAYNYNKNYLKEAEEDVKKRYEEMFSASKDIINDDNIEDFYHDELKDSYEEWSNLLTDTKNIQSVLKELYNKILDYQKNHQE